MRRGNRSPFGRVLLILALLAVTATPLRAATGYEVTGVNFSPAVTAGQFVRLGEDLTVSWTAPSGVVPDPMFYYLKFSEQGTALSNTEFNDAAYDFRVQHPGGFVTVPKSFFDGYNSDKLRYLHVKTQYLDTANGGSIAYSDDVVSQAIRIDNVAPTGTLTLDPASGSTKLIDVSMFPSESIKSYWLNDAPTFPGGTGISYSLFPTGTVGLREGTAYGDVTIYAWFEDQAGNRSTAASASAVYKYTAPVSIQYNTADLGVDEIRSFTVDGSTSYDWTITDLSEAGVAVFGSAQTTNVADVAIVGKKPGTFTVTATPTGGGTALKTATIRVVQTTRTVNIALAAGWNLISIPVLPANTAMATVLAGIAGKYSIVWGEFNPATSAWKNYNPAKPTNSLTAMEPNKGYWINVTEATTLSVTGGAAPAKGGSLGAGWNLIGYAGETDSTAITTVLAGIAGKYSIVWGEFNPATSAWKNYNPAKPTNSLTAMGAGKGYWVNMTEAATLSY